MNFASSEEHDAIREGESMADPLRATKVVDSIVVNMVDVGEETGDLDKMLMKIADNYDSDVDVLVSSLISILEPVMVVVLGVIGPWIAPYDPQFADLDARFLGVSTDHLLGTDSKGVDAFSQLLYGARSALQISIVVVAISATGGVSVGVIAGFASGDDECDEDGHNWCILTFSAEQKAVLFGVLIGGIGGLAGLVAGALRGSRDVYSFGSEQQFKVTPTGPPGSVAGERDVAMLRRWLDRGLVVAADHHVLHGRFVEPGLVHDLDGTPGVADAEVDRGRLPGLHRPADHHAHGHENQPERHRPPRVGRAPPGDPHRRRLLVHLARLRQCRMGSICRDRSFRRSCR